jgi:hypothetical protein
VKLPADAYIAPEKLTGYVLVKRSVGDKSEFWKRAGYTLDNARRLERDIRRQILIKDAVPTRKTIYGQHYEITITLKVKTVWIDEVKTSLTKEFKRSRLEHYCYSTRIRDQAAR